MLSRPWRHTARTNAVHPPPETRSPTPSAFVRSSFRGFGINSPVSRPSSCSLLISPIEALAAPASQCDGVLHISATYNFRHQRRYGVADSMPCSGRLRPAKFWSIQTASMRRRRIESTTGMRPGWPGRAGDFALSWSKMDSFSSVETKLERDYA